MSCAVASYMTTVASSVKQSQQCILHADPHMAYSQYFTIVLTCNIITHKFRLGTLWLTT